RSSNEDGSRRHRAQLRLGRVLPDQPLSSLLVLEVQRSGVDAVAKSGGRRTVFEHVPEMAAAAAARYLDAHHAVAPVGVLLDLRAFRRPGEAGPSTSRVDLLARLKEHLAAARAAIGALAMMIPVLAGEGALRPLLAEHAVLLGGEALTPLLLGRLVSVRLVGHGLAFSSWVRSAASASGSAASAHSA